MIPSGDAYKTSDVDPVRSRQEVERLLEKQGVRNFVWKRDFPENTYLAFERRFEGIDKPLYYKVQVPFVEKEIGSKWNKTAEYDEKRAYRFFYHIFKAMLQNSEIGMDFEQIFGNYLVIGALPDGSPMTVQDKITTSLMDRKNPALEFSK